MSHRYRSHCCCDAPEITQDCFLGFGTPPKKEFEPTKDRCVWENGGVYSNSQGGNIWDNWSFCSHNLNQELIVTVERTALSDTAFFASYNFPDIYCPAGCSIQQCQNGNCNDLIQECYDYADTHPPRSWNYTYPNRPMYARYRRLPSNTDVNLGRDWQNNPAGITERPYIWKQNHLGIGSPGWDPGVNGGHSIFPLYTNPNSPDGNPQDFFYPHGTANGVRSHCGGSPTDFAPCDDLVCTRVPNYYSYGDVSACSITHRGHSHYPLTNAQAQLIGSNWDTTEYGYIPTQGYAQGDQCVVGCPPEGEENPQYPYFNRIREYGGQYFWLQGISDHEQYQTFDENGVEDETRLYKNFILWDGQVIEIFRSSYCDIEPYGLWPIQLTLLSVIHRETWWEQYWSGFNRDGFRSIGRTEAEINGMGDYFVVDDGQSVGKNIPEMIGFGCSGIPVFSWELYYLYQYNVVDSEGNGSLVSDADILANKIPVQVIYNYISILEERQIDPGQLTDAAILSQSNNPDDVRFSHFIVFFFCNTYGFALPYQLTDILEKYDVLPSPRNYGEEQDYKIFKKKIRFYDVGAVDTTPIGCCVNIDEAGIGNCGFTDTERENFVENDSNACNLYEGFCEPNSCIYAPCADAVCELDSFCCDVAWDETCVQIAKDSFPDLCFSNSLCITSTITECQFVLGGQPNPNGTLCETDGPPVSFNPDLQTACKSNDPVIGSCCCFKVSDIIGEKEYLGCNEVLETECDQSACPDSANSFEFTPYSNCSYEGLVCNIDGDFTEWYDEIQDELGQGCVTWGNVKTRDFYFYGKQGGWTYYCRDALDGDEEIDYLGLGPNTYLFPARIGPAMDPDCWNAVPVPIQTANEVSDPLNDNRTDCTNQGTEIQFQFVYCNNVTIPEVETNTGDPTDDQGMIITCSNQSATFTCRGVWWQWHLQDYTFGYDQDTGESGRVAGCDVVNNSFWLVQDPYELGNSHTITLGVDSSGVTVGYANGVENGECRVVRGTNNKFFVQGILDASDEFNSESFVHTDGNTYNSIGLDFIVRGDNPADNPDQILYRYTPEVRFTKTDEFEYTFNPFEQLDEIEESKSLDISYWQVVETFESEELFEDGDGNQYRLYLYDIPYLNVYGIVSAIDNPDPEYDDYECNTNRIKYSDIAARMVEYQWYNPPYIKVTAQDPAFTYVCEESGYACGAGCHDTSFISSGGQCCNEISWLEGSPFQRGANSGPSPSQTSGNDQYYPPAP